MTNGMLTGHARRMQAQKQILTRTPLFHPHNTQRFLLTFADSNEAIQIVGKFIPLYIGALVNEATQMIARSDAGGNQSPRKIRHMYGPIIGSM